MSQNHLGVIFTTILFILSASSAPASRKATGEEHIILSKDPSCAKDVEKHCSSKVPKQENNFAIFVCLQELVYKDDEEISEECHQTMWHYKFSLTSVIKFDEAASKICESSISSLKECNDPKLQQTKGFFMNCMVENRHDIEDTKCKAFLNKMASIIFFDYGLIKGFYDSCVKDIKHLKCGQISKPDDEENTESHEQSDVVSCMETRFDEIESENCQTAVLKVAELQSDDYHMDRPLFYACQNARETFCKDIQSGEGRIYECLIKHSQQDGMDSECARKLLSREKMMQKDVKVNYPLWKSCEADYKKYNCEEERKHMKNPSDHGEGSLLLMCLSKHQADGSPIAQDCQNEMRTFAMLIFEQYQVSPIVVGKCDHEIHNQCHEHIGKDKDDGAMMNCLMGVAANNRTSLSEQCYNAIREVIKETGAGDNYKVDHGLQVACQSSIAVLCEDKQDSTVLACLMDNGHNPKMDPECREQVFHLQYFLARDFRLDSSLYRDCKEDAKKICHAKDWSEDEESMLPNNFVISCLYRNAILHDNPNTKTPFDKNYRVSDNCAAHVKRVMHQRATDIRLMPEIEQPCLADLGKFCTESHQDGEELDCLQQNFEGLKDECKEAVKTFTKMEAKDFDLDKHLVDKCGSMVTKYCKEELSDKDGERILPCLISHKNDFDMNPDCTTALEHWQLIEMKDIEFSPRLRDACFEDAQKLCKDAQSKYQAVRCLSQKIVENKSQVSPVCKKQIRTELSIQSENIQLNPELFEACSKDIKEFCHDVPPGGAQIEECLRRNFPKLKNAKCKKALFKQEEMESKDTGLDYRLMKVCKPMIKKYCQPLVMSGDNSAVMECLRFFTHDTDMSKDCRDIVFERQKEQAESFVLDPELSEYCDKDAERYCKKEMQVAKRAYDQGRGDEGNVFGCLVDVMIGKKSARLQPTCEQYVRRREYEAALEVELNPQFTHHCREEVLRLCGDKAPNEVIDCMKMNIPKINGHECLEETRKLIAEGIEDVHVDPFLEEACARDINSFCKDLPKKSGNVVHCLIDVHNVKNLHLKPDCDNFIVKRIQLYKDAHVKFEYSYAIGDSQNSKGIYMTLMIVSAVCFLGGILLGRIKRAISEQKVEAEKQQLLQ